MRPAPTPTAEPYPTPNRSLETHCRQQLPPDRLAAPDRRSAPQARTTLPEGDEHPAPDRNRDRKGAAAEHASPAAPDPSFARPSAPHARATPSERDEHPEPDRNRDRKPAAAADASPAPESRAFTGA